MEKLDIRLSSWGYGEPDDTCKDWSGDRLTSDALNYSEIGCLCCDERINLKDNGPISAGNTIHFKCNKGHRLIVAVAKSDLE